MQFGNFIEQAEQEDPKAKRLKMIKRQVLQKKVQAVRQGAGEDIVASHEPQGEMVEAKVDAGKSPETKEKDRNVRKFGVSHNVSGHGKLRRSLHKMNRGDKKIKGDKSAWTEMESVQHEGEMVEELSRRSKPSAKAKMAKLDAMLKRREERKVSEKEALKTEGWLGKKKEEKKPQKAMDAGARAKRKLQRREYAAKVSGSEDNVPDEMREGVGSAVKAVGKAAGKAVGFAAKSAAGVVGHGINALNTPGYKPKPKAGGSTANKSAGLSAAQSQAEKANKARLDARKKAIKKIKDDRRERATTIMTAEKAAKKVKKEGEDKKFKADSEKPIVAEFINHIWENKNCCKKCGSYAHTTKECKVSK